MAGQVEFVNFPLDDRPCGVQFTIHVTNYLGKGVEKKPKLAAFKKAMKEGTSDTFRIQQLINHYGITYCRHWFKEVYGWDFKEKAS